MYNTLISVSELVSFSHSRCVILDCRFRLNNPEYGLITYEQGHIPNAFYVHLEHILSGPKNGKNGRHPLPEPAQLAHFLGNCGINSNTQVITYDDDGGLFAARAWWLLRWLGHQAVAVLDGGLTAWTVYGGALTSLTPALLPCQFNVALDPHFSTVTAEDIIQNFVQPAFTLIDARSHERFLGHGETIDPLPGHIPGAINRPFRQNLTQEGYFKSYDILRKEWEALLNTRQIGNTVHQCGSGVSACHNILTLHHVFGQGGRLYPGSWSEWCSEPSRPRVTSL